MTTLTALVSTFKRGVAAAALFVAAMAAPVMGELQPPSVIPVKTVINSTGPEITLADLAENPAILPDEWKTRAVISSPDLGTSRQVPLVNIAYALQRYPDMNAVVVRGKSSLTVKRAGVVVEPAKIRAAVLDYIAGREDWRDLKIRADFLDVPDMVSAETTNIAISVTGMEYNARTATYTFYAEVRDDKTSQRIRVPAKMHTLARVWVAAQTIEKGAILADDNVRADWTDTDPISPSSVPATESIAGFEADRRILAGEIIGRTSLSQPICAERGAPIEVAAARSAIAVTMRAQAVTRGRRGDRITCVNDSSRRQFAVKLTAPGKGILLGN